MNAENRIFALGCTSLATFAEGLRTAARRKKKADLRIQYVPSSITTIRSDVDIYLVETVVVFLAAKARFSKTSVVVISDSPLLLSEIPQVRALDFDAINSWRFRLTAAPKPTEVIEAAVRMKKNAETVKWSKVSPERIDFLGLVINRIGDGGLLTPLNTINYQLDHERRIAVRKALKARVTSDDETSSAQKRFEAAVAANFSSGLPEEVRKALEDIRLILRRKGKAYRKALVLYGKGRSFNAILKSSNLTAYEIRYLGRLFEMSKKKGKADATVPETERATA